MLATAALERRFDEEEVLHETFLWHGTSDTDPMVICTSRDGVDARRVRRLGRWCAARVLQSWFQSSPVCAVVLAAVSV